MSGWRDSIQTTPAAAPPTGAPVGGWRSTVNTTPWAGYNGAGTGIREAKGSSYPMTPPEPKVIQEMHPDIGVFERLAAENLATGPQAKVDYLRQQHPGMDIKVDPKSEGQILVRKSGEHDYRVLNPTFTGLASTGSVMGDIDRGAGEGWMDLGGGAYDTLAGMASGAAATAGGAAGLVRGGIPGGVAGAVGAGGSTLAAMESLRQGLGQALGVNKEADLGQVVRAGEFGGAAPLAFGVPGVVKGAVPAAAGAFRENVAPKIGSFFSGISEGAIKSAKEHLGEFGDIAKRGIQKVGLATRDDTKERLGQHMAEAGKDIKGAVNAPGVTADLSQAETAIRTHLEELTGLQLEHPTDANQKNIDALSSVLTEHFGDTASNPVVSGNRAWNVQKKLEATAKGYQKSGDATERLASHPIFEAANNLHDQLNQSTGGAFSAANERFSNLKTIQENLAPIFGDTTGQKTYSKLSNIFSNANEPTLNNMREIDDVLGSNLEGTANLLQGYKQFNNPGLTPVSSGGTTSTSRSLLAGDAGQLAGEFVAPHAPLVQRAARTVAQATVGSPWVLKKQMQAGQGADWLKNYLGNAASPAATASAWTMLQGQGGNAP